jgi:hypothetical protein
MPDVFLLDYGQAVGLIKAGIGCGDSGCGDIARNFRIA